MQIKRIGYGIRGFGRMMNSAIRWIHMITEEATKRYKTLIFWKKHGLKATLDAFEVSERTLKSWRASLKKGNGMVESLNPKSRAPHVRRKRMWPAVVTAEIRRVREEHPNLGKEKIFVHLQAFCLEQKLKCPSVKTIGRIIADDPVKMRTFPQRVGHDGRIKKKKGEKKSRKPKGFKAKHPGHCVSLDTFEYILWGKKIYVITMLDLFSRYGFAYTTTSHASKAAEEFFSRCLKVFPYPIKFVLTDNGSEFMKHFEVRLKELHLTHWHTYPRTPKMNAHCERFNRIIQDEFFINHKVLLHNPTYCNEKLTTWLVWYNETRPHHSLKLLSPRQFLNKYEETIKTS